MLDSRNFLAGMNVTGDDVRRAPEQVAELLNPTPIRWLRIHTLPNRTLEEEGPAGHTYLDGIEYLCKNGYNIMAPIEVGYSVNVGSIASQDLEKFVEDSYQESFKASKKISEVAQKYDRQVIFCIENEIDIKSWILQALPGIGWRAPFDTWAKQALDFDLKYKRLNNILQGTKDAAPDAKTLANVVAEDLRVFFSSFREEIERYSSVLEKQSIRIKDITDEALDWKVELKHLKENLKVDYVGIDTYANWVLKYPVYGQETGSKVKEAAELTGKPVLNAEFGYTTYRTFVESIFFPLLGRPPASQMQLQFFKNTLSSIEQSQTMGTFPWVLITHPDLPANPRQEAYFGIFKMRQGQLNKEPAFDYYVEWLRRIVAGTS